jgi:thiosulfate dehydrogenase
MTGCCLIGGLVMAAPAHLGVAESQTAELRAPQELPPGELGRTIRLGKEIIEKTNQHPLSKPLVGRP